MASGLVVIITANIFCSEGAGVMFAEKKCQWVHSSLLKHRECKVISDSVNPTSLSGCISLNILYKRISCIACK